MLEACPTNADAGVGIGLKRGIQKFDKKGYELADKGQRLKVFGVNLWLGRNQGAYS